MSNERVIEFLLTPLMNNYVYYATQDQQAELAPQLIDSLNICLTILPVPSSKELKITRIGKLVNKMAKSQDVSEVRSLALQVVNKWKKELQRLKQEEEGGDHIRSKKEERSPSAAATKLD